MDVLTTNFWQLADKSIAVVTLIFVVFIGFYLIRDIRQREKLSAEKQDKLELEFRKFLIEQYNEAISTQKLVIEVVKANTDVIKAFVEMQQKTNSIISQHTDINQRLANVLNEHLVAWNLYNIDREHRERKKQN